jgi:hypothetical protein
MSASRLVPEAKRLGICSLAADLEGTGVLVPIAIRQFRFRLAPNPKLVEIRYCDRPIAHPIDQMPAHRDGQIVPRLNLGYQPPNTMRPS